MHLSCRRDIILTKLMQREMKVKGTWSRCLLEEYVKKVSYSYHCCSEMDFSSRFDVNFDKFSGV